MRKLNLDDYLIIILLLALVYVSIFGVSGILEYFPP